MHQASWRLLSSFGEVSRLSQLRRRLLHPPVACSAAAAGQPSSHQVSTPPCEQAEEERREYNADRGKSTFTSSLDSARNQEHDRVHERTGKTSARRFVVDSQPAGRGTFLGHAAWSRSRQAQESGGDCQGEEVRDRRSLFRAHSPCSHLSSPCPRYTHSDTFCGQRRNSGRASSRTSLPLTSSQRSSFEDGGPVCKRASAFGEEGDQGKSDR